VKLRPRLFQSSTNGLVGSPTPSTQVPLLLGIARAFHMQLSSLLENQTWPEILFWIVDDFQLRTGDKIPLITDRRLDNAIDVYRFDERGLDRFVLLIPGTFHTTGR
jgi:hypothetical protein